MEASEQTLQSAGAARSQQSSLSADAGTINLPIKTGRGHYYVQWQEDGPRKGSIGGLLGIFWP